MKIHDSKVNIFAGDAANSRVDRMREQNNKDNTRANIFAGNLNIQGDDISQKRKEAMRDALKIVSDAFHGDLKIDDNLESRQNKIENLKVEINDAQKELSKLDARKNEIKETYGISADSQEQKDLELLEKRRDSVKNPKIKLSDEEKERLAKIDEVGMTEYQTQSLEIDELIEPHKKVIEDNQRAILVESYTIEGIKLERLKTHPMVDANVAADKIMDAANSEINGMILDEAKDHVDQEMQDEKEAADKEAEKKKEQDEKIDAAREKKAEAEALANNDSKGLSSKDSIAQNDTSALKDTTEQILIFDETKKDVQREVQAIVDKMKLLKEDIKGAAVDTNI